jgi:hypothetical protein
LQEYYMCKRYPSNSRMVKFIFTEVVAWMKGVVGFVDISSRCLDSTLNQLDSWILTITMSIVLTGMLITFGGIRNKEESEMDKDKKNAWAQYQKQVKDGFSGTLCKPMQSFHCIPSHGYKSQWYYAQLKTG